MADNDPDQTGALVSDDDESGFDGEGDEVAREVASAPQPDEIDPTHLLDRDVAQERTPAAEEAAVHLTDPPPMGDGDGYLDD
jgi:hypothetical protein